MAARILLLDDNLDLAENVRDVLERARNLSEGGAPEIVIAHDAKTGLDLARKKPFDVAIVDVRLPDASGVDLVVPLREAMPQSEVVLLTGSATIENAIRALHAGASGFVLKTFHPDELVATVQQALQKVRLRRERETYERRYGALMSAAEVLIVGLDLHGGVVFFNAKLQAMLGVEEVSARGSVFVDHWIDPGDRKRFAAAAAEAVHGPPPKEFEVGMRDATGLVRRVIWRLSAANEQDPTLPDHVFGIGADVTERRALERRAANAEAMNAMAPLALGLAHEIRNPLNAAVLQLHLLGRAIDRIEDVKAQESMRHRVEIVVGEVRRLERLLTEFLELARPRPPQRERVDLDRVVSDVLELETEAAGRSNVRVALDLAPKSTVLGDVEKLKQVVLNLVVNAMDAMPEGGELEARVAREGGEVRFTLTDTGEGIDPAQLAEVFDPFFTTKPAGTGLGLAIVKKIIEQHSGHIEVTSRPERGTTVTIRLPEAPVGSDPRPSKAPPPLL